MKLKFVRQIYVKYSNIKCHKNQSSGSRVSPYGRTDTPTGGLSDGWKDNQTDRDLTKLIFAFLNFANAPIFDMQKLHVMISFQFIRAVLC